MTPERAAILAELRAKLAHTAPPVVEGEVLASGVSALDAAAGGWPVPGVSVVLGAPGSGRLGWVLPTLRRLTAGERAVAVVDVQGWLNPPGLLGVELHRLMIVRPGAAQAAWAAEQLARSGAVPFTVLLDPPPLGRAGRRLALAVEAGRTALVVITDRMDQGLPTALRLEITGPGQALLARGPGAGRTLALNEPSASPTGQPRAG